ncbi:MAG: capsular biosynthesis protein [Pseudomonadota bacterium]
MYKIKQKNIFFFIVLLPMFLVLVYYGLVAANRYVSESIVTIRQASDGGGSGTPGLAMMLSGINPGSREDTLYLQQYLHSMDMLQYLDKTLNLRKVYEAQAVDVFYRLFPWMSREAFFEYYKKRVQVVFDDISGLLTIRVQGFDPEFARKLNEELLGQSERFVNEISHRMAREQMAFADQELQKARARYLDAKGVLLAFQNKHNLLDPISQAQAMASVGTQLEGEITQLEAQLKDQLTYLQDGTHEIVALRNKIGALQAQLAKERARVASGEGDRMNTLAAEFQNLMLESVFAEDAYKLALAAVENARIEANRKLKSMVVIESPTLPDAAIYPRKLYAILTWLIGLLFVYGIVRMVLATIEDHRE